MHSWRQQLICIHELLSESFGPLVYWLCRKLVLQRILWSPCVFIILYLLCSTLDSLWLYYALLDFTRLYLKTPVYFITKDKKLPPEFSIELSLNLFQCINGMFILCFNFPFRSFLKYHKSHNTHKNNL